MCGTTLSTASWEAAQLNASWPTTACHGPRASAALALVEKVYSHLGTVRHRAEVVEYRVEQHTEVLGDRLEVLRPHHKAGKAEAA